MDSVVLRDGLQGNRAIATNKLYTRVHDDGVKNNEYEVKGEVKLDEAVRLDQVNF